MLVKTNAGPYGGTRYFEVICHEAPEQPHI